jgi:DNA-binding MarR family transcriptional regulator
MLRLAGAEGSTISRMAETTRMTPQAVSKGVDQLVALGLAERTPDAMDGRVKQVRQTRLGRQVAREIDDALARLEEEWRGSVGDRRLATMRACLEAFLAAGAPPAPARTRRTMRIRLT